MSSNHIECEKRIQAAIKAYYDFPPTTLRVIADQFTVPKSTLANRLNGKKTRTEAHEDYQILSNAEEKTLVRWVTRQTLTGYPITQRY